MKRCGIENRKKERSCPEAAEARLKAPHPGNLILSTFPVTSKTKCDSMVVTFRHTEKEGVYGRPH